MSEMFNNYPQPDDYIPNNRPKCHCPCKLDVMVGETSVQSFDIPFNVLEDCSNWEIIYKLGVDIVLTKKKEEIDIITQDDNTSLISCVLTPAETRLFYSKFLDTNVQIKFIMKNGDTIYSDIYKINITNALDAQESKHDVPVVSGFGWTED